MTKQDIDTLVARMLPEDDGSITMSLDGKVDVAVRGICKGISWHMVRDDLRRALYLAAGLTETGERKPERTRVWRGKSSWTGKYVWFEQEPKPDEFLLTDLTPGWFVPDGAA